MKFLNYIQENNLFNRENRILLAVSGGIDSMVMTHLFLKLGMRFRNSTLQFLSEGYRI